MDEKRRERAERETPIIDGDARPDMPISPEDIKLRQKKNRKTDKFQSERLSDINSLEDHKDAK